MSDKLLLANYGFNPRICKRCDRIQDRLLQTNASFNPRICKRCDIRVHAPFCTDGVSIHASVKDATCYGLVNRFSNMVSIHASVKDAT